MPISNEPDKYCECGHHYSYHNDGSDSWGKKVTKSECGYIEPYSVYDTDRDHLCQCKGWKHDPNRKENLII